MSIKRDFNRILRNKGARPVRKRCSGVGLFLAVFGMIIGYAAIAGFFFDYSLMTIFAKDIPWYADCIVGLFIFPVAVGAGLGCWVAVLCDVETPFVQPTPPTAEAPMNPTDA